MSVVQETTGSNKFGFLLEEEHKRIQARRDRLNAQIKPTDKPRPRVDADAPPSLASAIATGFVVYNTSGLALSGGGIRSAAFCLGAMQGLDVGLGFGKIDYLSSVSGGGYMGASLTASMAKTGGKFVFASPDDYSDQPAVGHLRNYSNYIFPRGERWSFPKGLAVVLRGLIVNFIWVLMLAIGFAIPIVALYPSSLALRDNSVCLPFCSASSLPATFTALTAAALLAFLVGWAVWRSHTHTAAGDTNGRAVRIGSILIIVLSLILLVDLQPPLIHVLFLLRHPANAIASATAWFKGIVTVLSPFAGIAAFFSGRLNTFLKSTQAAKGVAALAARLAARSVLWFAAIVLPAMVWLFFLYVCAAGIRDDETWNYPFSLGLFETGGYLLPWGQHLPVALVYLAAFVVLTCLTFLFAPNANSLHRLYRDRLSRAFLFYPETHKNPAGDDETTIHPLDAFKLTDMSPADGGPYHLINAALNIQSSRIANRRGRNADFFLFSSEFVGSDSTGYVSTRQMQETDPRLDLATAAAISGAAISSDMGSVSLGMLAPTLALLNLRLGYWMRNPSWIAGTPRITERLQDLPISYLALEMFGMLNETDRNIYLTDGGHIENLGIYQLLKRGCRTIIAVDADTDPQMVFSAFVKLERYARIDLGIRIELPWRDIAAASQAVNAAVAKGEPISAKSGSHCALGRILYPNGVVGYLLYIKASLSGDENDYILDYKRCNPSFPHESTGDQFFSEEQFEVYRALGFHAVNSCLETPGPALQEFLNLL